MSGQGRPGEELHVPPGPGIPAGLVVPAAALTERFSRSPGPGGQSVNTSDSRVELVLDLAACTTVTDPQRRRARRALAAHLVGDTVVVTASEHRSQHRNRIAARERLADLLRSALAPPPPPRRPTKPSRNARRRRVDAKVRRGHLKSLRGRVRDD